MQLFHPDMGEGEVARRQHGDEQDDEAAHHHGALHHIGHRIAQQAADGCVEDDDHRPGEQGEAKIDPGRLRQDLAHGEQLGRGPDDRGRDGEHGGGDLCALAKAQLHIVRKGHHAGFAQLVGEEEGHADQADRVAEGVSPSAGQAFLRNGAGGAHHRLRSEPGGKDGDPDHQHTEPAPGDEIIGFGIDEPAGPDRDGKLQHDINRKRSDHPPDLPSEPLRRAKRL